MTLKLKTKFLINVILLHIVLTFFIAYEFYTRQKDFILQETEKNTIAIAKNLASNSILWLLSNDITAMKELVQSQKLNANVKEALIIDKNRKIKASIDTSLIGLVPTDSISQSLFERAGASQSHMIHHDGLIDVITPIISDSIHIGYARVLLDTSVIQTEAQVLLHKVIALSFLAIVFGAFVAFFTIDKAMRRLHSLVEVAESIKKGNLDVSIESKENGDEIDTLANTLNKMLVFLKNTINELQELTANLHIKVKEAVDKQREQEAQLIAQSRIASMGEMIISITHHWRQPLNRIALIAQLLEVKHNTGELTPEELHKYTDDILKIVQSMSDILQGFQSFFAKSREDRYIQYELKMLASDILQLHVADVSTVKPFKAVIRCKVHNHEFHIGDKISQCNEFVINQNMSLVEQVFMNIVKNSADAIIVSPAEIGIIEIDFDRQGDTILIDFKDNGTGIPEDVIDRIFEPYFSTKDPAIYTGLGLYIVLMIVKKHLQGNITVKNNNGCHISLSISASTIYKN